MAETLTKEEIESFRVALAARLVALFRGVQADLREAQVLHTFSQDEPRDEADESERVQYRETMRSLDERNAKLAQAIEAALARIARGEYGYCVDCGEPIGRERLQLVPWAMRCAEDQEAFEAASATAPPTL